MLKGRTLLLCGMGRRLSVELQVARLERDFGWHGITDAGVEDYVDSTLTYGENLEAVERTTGMRLHQWTDGEIRAGVEEAKEHAAQSQEDAKDTYRAGTSILFRLR